MSYVPKPHLAARLAAAAAAAGANVAVAAQDTPLREGITVGPDGKLQYRDPQLVGEGSMSRPLSYKPKAEPPKRERLADWENQRCAEREGSASTVVSGPVVTVTYTPKVGDEVKFRPGLTEEDLASVHLTTRGTRTPAQLAELLAGIRMEVTTVDGDKQFNGIVSNPQPSHAYYVPAHFVMPADRI